jgi:hypothetical protein
MAAALSAFLDKILIAIQRLKSGRSARGAILICDNRALSGEAARRLETIGRDHCFHVHVMVRPPGAEGDSFATLLLRAFQALLAVEDGIVVSANTVRELTDALRLRVTLAPGHFEDVLISLFTEIGAIAMSDEKVLLVSVGELDRLKGTELAVLLHATHRAAQLQLPVLVCGAGTGRAKRLIGEAAGYGERLFEFVTEPAEATRVGSPHLFEK